jgi:hypothetical protein
MSNKQSLIDAVGALPEAASWAEITDRLLSIVAEKGTEAEFARLYRSQTSAAELEEFYSRPPQGGIALDDVIAGLEAR